MHFSSIKDNSTPLSMQEKLHVLKWLLCSYNSTVFIEILYVFSYSEIIKYIVFLDLLEIITFYDTWNNMSVLKLFDGFKNIIFW